MVLGNRICPQRVVERGLGRGNKQKDNGREFFRPDNEPLHRLSPKQDKLNRNLYPKTITEKVLKMKVRGKPKSASK